MSMLPPPPPIPDGAQPRWGLGDVAFGAALAYGLAAVFGIASLAATGYLDPDKIDELPLWLVAIQMPPLWFGFIGVPIWAAQTKGYGWLRDFKVAWQARDVPIGIASGLVGQFIFVPLVSIPILILTSTSAEDLGAPARELADKADSAWGVVLFFVIVGICAPLAEELFWRGLVLRSMEKRWNRTVALVGSSAMFGAFHLQPLQFAGLTVAGLVFGGLALRYERLGPAIVAHMVFNTATVVVLVAT